MHTSILSTPSSDTTTTTTTTATPSSSSSSSSSGIISISHQHKLIGKLEIQIEEVSKDIKKVEEELKKVDRDKDKEYWRNLWDKEKHLRGKETFLLQRLQGKNILYTHLDILL
jgi:hypothetical protein